jgi:1,4-alpha-glucan branching enzyme
MGWRPGEGDMLSALGDGSWAGAVPGIGDGDPYMFFVVGQGSAGWKRDPYARELTADPVFPGSYCLVRDPASYTWQAGAWRPPPYEDLIIYQLHIGTWWASDETGADARKLRSGTFLDAAEKLDYLRELGVTAVQLLPVQEFATANSMGYNGVDYFSPEGEYLVPAEQIPWRLARVNAMFAACGKQPLTVAQLTPGINQLKCFIDLCHLNGIAVIFDLVYNHAGGGFDDNSIWFYDRQANGNQNNSLFFTDQGWAGGQIFAYWNDWVSQFLIDNASFFVRECRIDGIRYDEVRVIENNGGRAFCQNLTQTVRATSPSAIQIAEYWNPDRSGAVAAPPDGLGFDAELGDGLRDALRALVAQASGGESASLDLSGVAANLPTPGGFAQPWRIVHCMENQDLTYAPHSGAARVPVLADPADHASWFARSRSRVATALLFAAPGIPSIFMGEEFLEDSNWSDDRGSGGLIDWSALNGPSTVHRDFQRFVADLIALRRAHPAFRASGIRVSRCDNYDRVLVLHRWVEGQGSDVVAIASFDERPKFGYSIGLPCSGMWREIFNSDDYDGFPNAGIVGNGGYVWAGGGPSDGFAASAAMTLPPNGIIVLGR